MRRRRFSMDTDRRPLKRLRAPERTLIHALAEISRLQRTIRCGKRLKEKEAFEWRQRCEYLDMLKKQDMDDIKAQEAIVSKVLQSHPEYVDDYKEFMDLHGILADEVQA